MRQEGMRIPILSAIHADRQALEAVVAASGAGAQRFVILGYGGVPA